MKIIIVDDSKTYRDVLKVILTKNFNYEIIEEFESGEAILDSKQLNKADIILMDLMMPGKDGFETTKEILQNYKDAKIIAVTMKAEKPYLEQMIEVGFKGCILKDNFYTEIQKGINIINEGGYFFPDV